MKRGLFFSFLLQSFATLKKDEIDYWKNPKCIENEKPQNKCRGILWIVEVFRPWIRLFKLSAWKTKVCKWRIHEIKMQTYQTTWFLLADFHKAIAFQTASHIINGKASTHMRFSNWTSIAILSYLHYLRFCISLNELEQSLHLEQSFHF